MSIPTGIDQQAPVRARHEIDVSAPLDTVWRLHAGVHVTTQESFAGEPVAADISGMQSALDHALAAWLAHLKAGAEAGG